MRIISGLYKGRQLASPKDLSVRPTTDKVRNAVFSVLFDKVDDAKALDLFCGTGSYGLEALSRGASSCTFIDKDVTYINKNLKGLEEFDTEVIKGDVLNVLARMSGSFDIIFIDPPYGEYQPDELLNLIKERDLLAEDGIVIYEESVRTGFNITTDGFGIETEKKYGDTKVYFICDMPESGE